MDQSKTPLFDQLLSHREKKPVSFHVPGHKNGNLVLRKTNNLFQSIMEIDMTELSGLDDLHSPEGVILEAELLLSELYKVKKSYFLVNGSTVGNIAMILAALKPGDIALVQRNCHKSIFNGLKLAGAIPVFLGPEIDDDLHVASGISADTIKKAINSFPEAKALIITYPNYYGIVNNIKTIIEIAHQYNVPVLVDEAHGAHFIASDKFPPSAVQLGADIVVQSAHKTLPALTMGSFLHFNSEILLKNSVTDYLSMLQSSSPSYPIMASLDIARSYLGTYSIEDAQFLQNSLEDFREGIKENALQVIPFRKDMDPLKVILQSTTSLSGFELQAILEDEGIYTELADPYNILLVMPLLKKGSLFKLEESIGRINKAFSKISNKRIVKRDTYIVKEAKISSPILTIEEMDKLSARFIPLDQAKGHICAEMIIPYPPGIPLLLHGEMIQQEDLCLLQTLLEKKARFQGGASLKEGKIKIYKL